ncbi:MAG: TolC family outer membrane protein [Gammaproteobacteria bacterium]
MPRPETIIITFAFLFYCSVAAATDLVEAYALAEASDPVYKESIAAYNATLEVKPQARSQLLPLISFNASTTRHDQDISTDGEFGSSGEVDFNSHGYSLDLSQPVFHYDRYLALKQSDSQILQAQAEMDVAQQDLIVRVAERYFNVLAALDNQAFTHAEKKALGEQLEQTKQRFDAGITAITDVQEAQAGFDRSVASEILAVNLVDNSREGLREVTGEYLTDLAPLGETIELAAPRPEVIDEWTATALEQNLRIVAAKYALDTAQQTIKIEQSGHLPTLDIVATKNYGTSGGRFGGTELHDSAIGLELNVPIYQGGLVNSRTRQATYNYEEALERLEQQRRAAQRLTREAFLGVISSISQVNALRQSVVSSETALEATQAGFDAGTRTAVDVVDAQRVVLQAQRAYALARYDYLLNILRLKQAAGTLSPDDLSQINAWLGGNQ